MASKLPVAGLTHGDRALHSRWDIQESGRSPSLLSLTITTSSLPELQKTWTPENFDEFINDK